MSLTDLILKAKVNMALVRDPRVSATNITVRVENGVAILTGDLDRETECAAADEIVHSVEGIRSVQNEMTCGVHVKADTAELVALRLVEKLDDEWLKLPNAHALTQADYVRWALWLIHKFRLPAPFNTGEYSELEATILDQALTRVAGYVGGSKALLAIEMMREVEQVAQSPLDAPPLPHVPLSASPAASAESAAAA